MRQKAEMIFPAIIARGVTPDRWGFPMNLSTLAASFGFLASASFFLSQGILLQSPEPDARTNILSGTGCVLLLAITVVSTLAWRSLL